MFNLAAFIPYAIITAITPGPNNILSMSNASRFGFRRSFPFNLGVFSGFLIVMGICTFVARLAPVEFWQAPAMRVPGALYMLYLAWKTAFSAAEIEETNARNGFVSGLLLQFVNPKIYIYGITSMAIYILPYFSAPVAQLLFMVLLAAIGLACTVLWALFGAAFRRILRRHGRAVGIVMGLALCYCAVSLFI